MGTRLMPAIQIRNTISSLIDCNAIQGDLAKTWKEQERLKEKVDEEIKRADSGDVISMEFLASWYSFGINGLPKDEELSLKWSRRAADLHHPPSMAVVGDSMLESGIPSERTQGMIHVVESACQGSDLGAYYLGWYYKNGEYDLEQDHKKARYWFNKVVDGSSRFDDLSEDCRKYARKFLSESKEK